MQHHQERDSKQEHAKRNPEVAVGQNSFGKAGRLHLNVLSTRTSGCVSLQCKGPPTREHINEINTVTLALSVRRERYGAKHYHVKQTMIRKLCNVDQLPEEGKLKAMQGDGLDLCIGVLEGRPYAVQNQCPHQGAPLAAGYLQDGCVVCPYHAWRFRISDGAPENAGDSPLSTYELRTYSGDVLIQLPST